MIALQKSSALKRILHLALKYRIFHVVFWLWHWQALAHVMIENTRRLTMEQCYGDALVKVSFQIICVYTVTGYLIPKFLQRRGYSYFLLYSLLVMTGVSVVSTQFSNIYLARVVHGGVHEMFWISAFSAFMDLLMIVAFFTAIVIAQKWYQNDQMRKLLEKEKLEAELNFLKAQINPHFLFNTLNSIYVLMEEERQLAGEIFIKFSELLRYQLYECSTDRTSIYQEMNFISNYIELEKLRKGDTINIRLDITPGMSHFRIAPFLLIPFIENAFKHTSGKGKNGLIHIKADFRDNRFMFSTLNTVNTDRNESPIGGIGLSNVKRRLNLLYKDRYSLDIQNDETYYKVNLKLQIHEDELYHS